MRLFRHFLAAETARCVTEGVRLTIIGRRDRFASAILRAAAATSDDLATDGVDRDRFAAALGAAYHECAPAPDVDLLVRTGGEQRLSDFLLWEAAYAELWFTPTLCPDFRPAELARAVADLAGRERRFGVVGSATDRKFA